MTATRVRPAASSAASARSNELRGLDLVACRPILAGPTEVSVALAPGDRALVAAGDAIVAGTTIAERLRDAVVNEDDLHEQGCAAHHFDVDGRRSGEQAQRLHARQSQQQSDR